MTKKVSVYDYLLMKKDDEGVTIDTDNLEKIIEEYAQLTGEKPPTKPLLERLAKKLKIQDDDKNLELLRLCINAETNDDAKDQICQRFTDESSPKKTSSVAPKTSDDKSIPADKINEINCLIQIKVNHEEINTFFKDFLLRSLDQPVSSGTNIVSLEKTIVHPLNRRCILDLFIRKQMAERGVIDFGRKREKFRLVESISLNDEFDTWHFDHFHSLFEFSLTRPNDESFCSRWQLTEQAKITYKINSIYSINDDQKQIQRPSTKSLEIFIEEICRIEDNGMASDWIDLLRKEDINTYAHLTNLNQKEWERIKKLSMNALKTIKTYVDREKQTAEDQTSSTKSKGNKRKSIIVCI